jgi:hypothetical protein
LKEEEINIKEYKKESKKEISSPEEIMENNFEKKLFEQYTQKTLIFTNYLFFWETVRSWNKITDLERKKDELLKIYYYFVHENSLFLVFHNEYNEDDRVYPLLLKIRENVKNLNFDIFDDLFLFIDEIINLEFGKFLISDIWNLFLENSNSSL